MTGGISLDYPAFVLAAHDADARDSCGTHAVHLCPVMVIALACVASLDSQILDPRWTGHRNPTDSLLNRIWYSTTRTRPATELWATLPPLRC
jgi:hypothetical protein